MVFDLFDADSLTSKDQTEIYFLSLVADASARGDGYSLIMERIVVHPFSETVIGNNSPRCGLRSMCLAAVA